MYSQQYDEQLNIITKVITGKPECLEVVPESFRAYWEIPKYVGTIFSGCRRIWKEIKINKRFSQYAFKAVAVYFVDRIFIFILMVYTAIKSLESQKIGSLWCLEKLLSKTVPYPAA